MLSKVIIELRASRSFGNLNRLRFIALTGGSVSYEIECALILKPYINTKRIK